MTSPLIEIITSPNPEVRDRSLDAFCRRASRRELLAECEALERFRRASGNLYERVRALFFLYAIHRFHLPQKLGRTGESLIPYDGYTHLLQRRFEEAIDIFLGVQAREGPSDGISSALAQAYHRLGFQTLADQVRRSVRSAPGNQWMFRTGHPADQPLRVRPELLERTPSGLAPILHEATPVRMDPSHSGWSDIFFLGMDFPEGARVLNVSIDLAVHERSPGASGHGRSPGTSGHGRDPAPKPPVEAFFRVIDEPVLRLASVDLRTRAEITTLREVFDFARDYLGLLKAAIIAAGIVPPGMEGAGQPLADLLARLVGPGNGLEIVSRVNGIPKGSRLAVSTSLLASLIAVCMRATGQTRSLTGTLAEHERRLVAARAILGEWLAGSGGGWQDSGGLWPGIKLITGVQPGPDDPEYGVSRGRLLPAHHVLGPDEVSPASRQRLQESVILFHGGMAQDVGPILEMVTEKYLLRSEEEWQARLRAYDIFDEIVALLRAGDIEGIGDATSRNFFDPITTIIPWATNYYTERLIARVKAAFGEHYWGFWMLGGMSGGGMGFYVHPAYRQEAQAQLLEIMRATKRELEHALPFGMEPVVYDFAINPHGSFARLRRGDDALMPPGYYTLTVPELLQRDVNALSPLRRAELDRFGAACRTRPELAGMVQTLFDRIMPQLGEGDDGRRSEGEGSNARRLQALLDDLGFDPVQHEQIRDDLRSGRIGLAQNRLPASTEIRDVQPGDVEDFRDLTALDDLEALGLEALRNGEAAVVTLAAGVGSRWTHGAGVVKALHPFCKLDGAHRSFIETHLAKSRRVGRLAGRTLLHLLTTSYLTHAPIETYLGMHTDGEGRPYGYPGQVLLSPGRTVGLRFVPMARDLRFAWEEMPQQLLDEQAQKVLESLHAALIAWAEAMGEGTDYTDNLPLQCLHPVGHWYEIPNLLKNGVLAGLLERRPQLKYLMMHNIDTVGTDLNPALLGGHIRSGATMSVEVITRRVEDRGGGLARVDGDLRLIEGLALPHEEDEFRLTYYNTNTFWFSIDRLLEVFGLNRDHLREAGRVAEAVRALGARMPTYITLKDVKKRWGHGQEDIYPVAQFEKLWGDMTALPEMACRYVVVPRMRGQQLKEQAQLDGWLRDGSAAYVEALCAFERSNV
ncbi:MAG: UTP--glucose-1-phosphate uridylyltransferase [Armatimonadota bacterium]